MGQVNVVGAVDHPASDIKVQFLCPFLTGDVFFFFFFFFKNGLFGPFWFLYRMGAINTLTCGGGVFLLLFSLCFIVYGVRFQLFDIHMFLHLTRETFVHETFTIEQNKRMECKFLGVSANIFFAVQCKYFCQLWANTFEGSGQKKMQTLFATLGQTFRRKTCEKLQCPG